MIPCDRAGERLRGAILFPRKENSPPTPQEKGTSIASKQLEGVQRLPIAPFACGRAAFAPAIRLDLLLLSAVAQPLAALLPYGCGTPLAGAALPVLRQCSLISVYRQSPQCGERSNAAFGKQSAAEQTSLAPHDSKARLKTVTTRRDSWRSHVHRTRFRRLRSSSSCKLPMCGVEGEGPSSFLLWD